MAVDTAKRSSSAYYGAEVGRFLVSDTHQILGLLWAAETFRSTEAEQKSAWIETIEVLKASLVGTDGWVFLEFNVPRLGSRIDAVLISGPAIFPIEFKCGEKLFTRDALNQSWDYALDLKNFHLESRAAPIFPLLASSRP